jgi:hypothetical protein
MARQILMQRCASRNETVSSIMVRYARRTHHCSLVEPAAAAPWRDPWGQPSGARLTPHAWWYGRSDCARRLHSPKKLTLPRVNKRHSSVVGAMSLLPLTGDAKQAFSLVFCTAWPSTPRRGQGRAAVYDFFRAKPGATDANVERTRITTLGGG